MEIINASTQAWMTFLLPLVYIFKARSVIYLIIANLLMVVYHVVKEKHVVHDYLQ